MQLLGEAESVGSQATYQFRVSGQTGLAAVLVPECPGRVLVSGRGGSFIVYTWPKANHPHPEHTVH